MWGSKQETSSKHNFTLISKGTKVVGDVHFSGELQVEGKVIGNIIAEGSDEARVVVHEKGFVEGEIRVPSAIVNGEVVGDVRSTKHIELASKAIIKGNVFYSLIEVVKGAQVNGNLLRCDDSATSKTAINKSATAQKAGPKSDALSATS